MCIIPSPTLVSLPNDPQAIAWMVQRLELASVQSLTTIPIGMHNKTGHHCLIGVICVFLANVISINDVLESEKIAAAIYVEDWNWNKFSKKSTVSIFINVIFAEAKEASLADGSFNNEERRYQRQDARKVIEDKMKEFPGTEHSGFLNHGGIWCQRNSRGLCDAKFASRR